MTGIKVTETLSVSPQISVDMLEEIKSEGFEQIICNRPDGESPDQTPFDEISKRALSLGLEIIHQPITPMTLNPENAQAFLSTIGAKKTFAYCRTGTRCITLWAMAQLENGANPDDIMTKGQECGYDLGGLVGRYI